MITMFFLPLLFLFKTGAKAQSAHAVSQTSSAAAAAAPPIPTPPGVNALHCKPLVSTNCSQFIPPIPNFEAYCAGNGPSPWESRLAVAASWIWEHSTDFVLDLGAGCSDMREMLPQNVTYIPDEVNRGGCDYNRAMPELCDEQKQMNGIITALGVIEYLCDPLSFLIALKDYNQPVIISYAAVHDALKTPIPPRINALTQSEWDALLSKAGWTLPQHSARVMTATTANVVLYFPRPPFVDKFNAAVKTAVDSTTGVLTATEQSQAALRNAENGALEKDSGPGDTAGKTKMNLAAGVRTKVFQKQPASNDRTRKENMGALLVEKGHGDRAGNLRGDKKSGLLEDEVLYATRNDTHATLLTK